MPQFIRVRKDQRKRNNILMIVQTTKNQSVAQQRNERLNEWVYVLESASLECWMDVKWCMFVKNVRQGHEDWDWHQTGRIAYSTSKHKCVCLYMCMLEYGRYHDFEYGMVMMILPYFVFRYCTSHILGPCFSNTYTHISYVEKVKTICNTLHWLLRRFISSEPCILVRLSRLPDDFQNSMHCIDYFWRDNIFGRLRNCLIG